MEDDHRKLTSSSTGDTPDARISGERLEASHPKRYRYKSQAPEPPERIQAMAAQAVAGVGSGADRFLPHDQQISRRQRVDQCVSDILRVVLPISR
jgi:hypothetical protein